MKQTQKNVIVVILAVVLSLAAWSSALELDEFNYQDGDVLEAATFNALLNDNFAAVKAEFALLRGEISGLEAQVSNLEGQVDTLTAQLTALQVNTPIAYGTIIYDGMGYKELGGTDNWEVVMAPGAGTYTAVITIADVSYTTASYTTIVTPAGAGTAALTPAAAARVSAASGKLQVDMVDDAGNHKLAHFQFITFRNQ